MAGRSWETGWVLEMPSGAHDLLVGLLVRDLLNGASFDVEFADEGVTMELDLTCGDELEEGAYRLLIMAEVRGTEDHDLVEAAVADLVAEAEEEAGTAAEAAQLLGVLPEGEVEFRAVPEDAERWDLVIPDWLAPDGAEVPFGFRSFHGAGPWPSDAELDRFSRVVLVPGDGEIRAWGVTLRET